DRRLYDAFASWLRGQGPQGYSFPESGQEMSINFAHVQRMEIEAVADAAAGGPHGSSVNPVPLTAPPPLAWPRSHCSSEKRCVPSAVGVDFATRDREGGRQGAPPGAGRAIAALSRRVHFPGHRVGRTGADRILARDRSRAMTIRRISWLVAGVFVLLSLV